MMKQVLFLFTGILGLFFFVYFKLLAGSITTTPININQVSTAGAPITATFISPDMRNEDFPGMIAEMKSVGIDTIIMGISEVTSPDCGTSYKDTYFLDNTGSSWAVLIRTALAADMKIFVGPRGLPVSDYECMSPTKGTASNPATPMGHVIAHFMTSIDKYKSFLASEGVAWTDPRVAGLYISEEVLTEFLTDKNPGNITYFKELSSRAKVYGKPMLISPGQAESTDYTKSLQAFKNIIDKTDITIIAPQDSMGSGVTRTFTASADHFRALADARAAYPAKNVEAWANIELFQHPNEDKSYVPDMKDNPPRLIPAPFSRVKSQIEAARPYVSKMTCWEYQHNMMILSSATNLSSILTWNNQYTPGLATRRAKLRSDYLAAYGGITVPTPTPPITPSPTPTIKPSPAPSRTPNPSITPTPSPTPTQKPSIAPTPTPTPTPSPTPISSAPSIGNRIADLNKDGKINIFDYNIFVSEFGKSGSYASDVDHDGQVTIKDYNLIIMDWVDSRR